MAVRLNLDELAAEIGTECFTHGERLFTSGDVRDVDAATGGAEATVWDGDESLLVWTGLVDHQLVADCACLDTTADQALCAHAVAVILAAEAAGVRWSASATPPSEID